jgi:cyclic pyranopterin phosphate synthase
VDHVPVPLVDPYQRTVRDLRISIIDRCNFRCTYCMPEEGMKWLPRADLLTFGEIERITRVCVERYGFESVRLTGGEPTVRAQLPQLVGRLSALGVEVALTTNGATLGLLAAGLKAAGWRASTSPSTRCDPTASRRSPDATRWLASSTA